MTLDLITTAFELFGFVCIAADCRAVYRDKAVRGVSIWSRVLYMSWAGFNVYLFGVKDMPFAATMAGVSVLIYVAWLSMAVYYRRICNG